VFQRKISSLLDSWRLHKTLNSYGRGFGRRKGLDPATLAHAALASENKVLAHPACAD